MRRWGILAAAAVIGAGACVAPLATAQAALSAVCSPEALQVARQLARQMAQALDADDLPPVWEKHGATYGPINDFDGPGAIYASACLFEDRTMYPTVRLHGTITQADAETMERMFDFEMHQRIRPVRPGVPQPFQPRIVVDSPGGDLGAATDIGRILRQYFSMAFVYGECMSACIAVAAGANIRIIGVPLGLHSHRPGGEGYTGLTLREARQRYNATLDDLAAFLDEGGVSPDVVDIMRSTPSTSIRFVQGADAEALGFHTIDPAFREYHLDRIGQDCGPAAQRRFADFLAQVDVCVPRIPASTAATGCYVDAMHSVEADLAQHGCALVQ